jgi:uncharacterized lipoprotein YmbA
MHLVLRSLAASVLAFALLFVAGCGKTEPSRFYVLSYDHGQGGDAASTTAREGVGIGVGPVELPQYLDRPHVVTRSSDNKLELAEFDQWGGNLEDNFGHVLAENLSFELSTDRVSVYPWKASAPIEYQVTVQVTAFEVDGEGDCQLDVRWSIVDQEARRVLVMARSSYREKVGPEGGGPEGITGYEAVAAAMSRNISNLGRDIAAKIKALSGQ